MCYKQKCKVVSLNLAHPVERGIAAASCLSVTLMYRDHIGWNSSKVISPLVSLGCSLSADPNVTDLLQGEHPKILAGIGVGSGRSGFQHTAALISLKCSKIAVRLLLMTNREFYTWFRLVPKSMISEKMLHRTVCTALVLSFI